MITDKAKAQWLIIRESRFRNPPLAKLALDRLCKEIYGWVEERAKSLSQKYKEAEEDIVQMLYLSLLDQVWTASFSPDLQLPDFLHRVSHEVRRILAAQMEHLQVEQELWSLKGQS